MSISVKATQSLGRAWTRGPGMRAQFRGLETLMPLASKVTGPSTLAARYRCMSAKSARPSSAYAIDADDVGSRVSGAEPATDPGSAREAEFAAVKARAWYLQDQGTVSPTENGRFRKPVFTSYDPNSTMPIPSSDLPVPPVPKHFPQEARDLHAWLTHPEDNHGLFMPHTVRILDTSESTAAQATNDSQLALLGGRRRRGIRGALGKLDNGTVIKVEGQEIGAYWTWIIFAQTAARGKGAVRRAEKALREWLYMHPLESPAPEVGARPPKFRSSSSDAEWCLVEAGNRVCINLMTEKGKEDSLVSLLPDFNSEIDSDASLHPQDPDSTRTRRSMQNTMKARPSGFLSREPQLDFGLRQTQSGSSYGPRHFHTSLRAQAVEEGRRPPARDLRQEVVNFDDKASPSSRYPPAEAGRNFLGAGTRSREAQTQGDDRMARQDRSVRQQGLGTSHEEAFDGPSRPRPMFDRPKEARELPAMKTFSLPLSALEHGAPSSCMPQTQRLSSSILRQVTYQLRNSDEVKAMLGDNIRYAPNWWGFGEPWISGSINLMQGKVDLKFRIQGSKDVATVYFTSVRPEKDAGFRVVRYKVVSDRGETLQMQLI